MKKIRFNYENKSGLNSEVVEFEDEATEKEIDDAFVEWVWQFIEDNVWMDEI